MAKKLTKEQAKELLIKEYVRRMVKKALKILARKLILIAAL